MSERDTLARDPASRPDPEERAGPHELFAPSLQGYAAPATQDQPWRLSSQFWVAFFGGVLAATLIAWQNGKRLGLAADRLRLILLVGAAGLLLVLGLTFILVPEGAARLTGASRSGVRLGGRIVAVLAYLVFYQLQKGADRIYQYRSGGNYGSLWRPGLIAVFAWGTLQAILTASVLALR